MKRFLAILLSGATTCLTWGADPVILQLRVIEGEGAVYGIGSRSARGITVQVTDETGKPVDNATVSFLLPEQGPGGVFRSGAHTEIVTTRADGRASVWGMQWNRSPGPFEVRITASKGQARAGLVCPQYLSEATVASRDRTGSFSSHRSHSKWVILSLVAAGAVGAGYAGSRLNKNSTPAAPGAKSLTIGAPTITIGHP